MRKDNISTIWKWKNLINIGNEKFEQQKLHHKLGYPVLVMQSTELILHHVAKVHAMIVSPNGLQQRAYLLRFTLFPGLFSHNHPLLFLLCRHCSPTTRKQSRHPGRTKETMFKRKIKFATKIHLSNLRKLRWKEETMNPQHDDPLSVVTIV